MASPCLCKPPTVSEPASRVKPVLKQMFGRASRKAAREALPRAVPNGARHLQGRAERGAAAAGQATRAGAEQQGAKAGRQQGSGAAGLACKLDATGVSAGREASAHGDRPDLVA